MPPKIEPPVKLSNEGIESIEKLFNEVDDSFNAMEAAILKNHKDDKENPDIKRLRNLYKCFYTAARKGEKTLIHPVAILGKSSKLSLMLKAMEKETDQEKRKPISESINKEINKAQHSKSIMARKMEKYNESTSPRIEFNIKSGYKRKGQRGSYFLYVTIHEEGEDVEFFDYLGRLKTPNPATKTLRQSPEEEGKTLQKYLNQIKEDYRYIDTKYLGMLANASNAIEIKEAYTRLKAVKDVSLSEASHLTEHTRDLSGIPESYVKEKNIVEKPSGEPIFIEDVLRDALEGPDTTKRHIVLLGSPGSGKTTQLCYLAHVLASGEGQALGLQRCIPFFVKLSAFGRSNSQDLIEFALDEATKSNAPDNDKHALRNALKEVINNCNEDIPGNEHVLFLLDALDETQNKKGDIVEAIERMRNRCGRAAIIVTSRATGYYGTPLKAFFRYFIEDLQGLEINKFIGKWFDTISKEKASEVGGANSDNSAIRQTTSLINQLENNPSLRRIAATPLYLTFLIALASDPDTELPQTRAGLYDLYFEKLLFEWEKKYGLPFPSDVLFCAFIETSWIIHRALFGDVKQEPTAQLVKNSVEGSLKAGMNEMLDFWIKAGIFIRVKTKHLKELILPRHLSFLEYGFACKLATMWKTPTEMTKAWHVFKDDLLQANLIEPMAIFVGKLADPAAFVERILKLKSDIFVGNIILAGRLTKEIGDISEQHRLLSKIISLFLKKERLTPEFVQTRKADLVKSIGGLKYIAALQLLLDKEENTELKSGEKSIAVEVTQLPEWTDVIQVLEGLFWNEKDTEIKEAILGIFEEIGNNEIIPVLTQLYEKENDWRARVMIVKKLKQHGQGKILRLLEELYEKETDAYVKATIAWFIGNGGDNQAVSFLRRAYSAKNAKKEIALRRFIVRAISRSKSITVIRVLKELYKQEEEGLVRGAIISGVSLKGSSKDIRYLKKCRGQEKDALVRGSIIKAIGRIGGANETGYLKGLFTGQNNPSIRSVIVEAIGEGNDDSAIPLLQGWYSNEKNGHVRLSIVNALSQVGHERVAKYLEELYAQQEESEEDRYSIVMALSKTGGKDVLDFLRKRYDGELSDRVKRAILWSIAGVWYKDILEIARDIPEYEEIMTQKEMSDVFIRGKEGAYRRLIMILKGLFEKERRGEIRNKIAKQVHTAAQRGNILIYAKRHKEWEIREMPARYGLKKESSEGQMKTD